MAPTASHVIRLHRPRTTVAPVAPLLSPTTCLRSVEGKPANHASAVVKLSSIHNADLDREMARRWLDEGYDFYAPDEVARRNELYEAFARRVAALQSTDTGLGEQADSDFDEYVECDELRVVMEKNAVVKDNTAQVVRTNLPSVPKPRAPNPTVPVTPHKAQATKGNSNSIDSKTRVAQVPATEPKGSCEPQEKNAAVPLTGTPGALVASKLAPPPLSPTLSQIQHQELDMVKAYLAKLAADFTWETTASQGLEPMSEDCAIGLSAYVIAYGYEKAVKKVCGVLSHESPFKAQPTVMGNDGRHDQLKGSPRKLVEKGVLRTPPRRFNGSPDAVLNKSREALSEELRRKKMESAASKVSDA